MKHPKHRFKGFTLIELMITIAIVGMLSSVALPAYQNYTGRARAAEAMPLLAAARTEFMVNWLSTGTLPTDDQTEYYLNEDSEAVVRWVIWSDSRQALEAWYGPGAGHRMHNKILWFKADFSANQQAVNWTCMNHTSSGYAIPENWVPC